jgi:hypothetical protein
MPEKKEKTKGLRCRYGREGKILRLLAIKAEIWPEIKKLNCFPTFRLDRKIQ